LLTFRSAKRTAIVTTILSFCALVLFTVNAVNAAGVLLPWNAALPGVGLSLVQLFLLILVFWISSRTKRFLCTRGLVNSGLERSLQYAISQIVSNVVLIIGIFIALENTGPAVIAAISTSPSKKICAKLESKYPVHSAICTFATAR
jgi:hypothetical protein